MRELLGLLLALALAASIAIIITGDQTASVPIVADYSGTIF
jgi:hypothetical protein